MIEGPIIALLGECMSFWENDGRNKNNDEWNTGVKNHISNLKDLFSKTAAGLTLACFVAGGFTTSAAAMSDETVKKGFIRTVMSAEYGSGAHVKTVKKYNGYVRFAVVNHSKRNRRPAVTKFVRQLNGKIRGLRAGLVGRPSSANFIIHVVDKSQYADVLRKHVFRSASAPIRGRCYAHVKLGSKGIQRTSVVIVSDAGEKIFKRCLVEEVLQGLGPLNDAAPASLSVFSGSSRHTTFTHYDRILMNVLYDPRVKAGMTKKQVLAVLPKVISDTRRRLP